MKSETNLHPNEGEVKRGVTPQYRIGPPVVNEHMGPCFTCGESCDFAGNFAATVTCHGFAVGSLCGPCLNRFREGKNIDPWLAARAGRLRHEVERLELVRDNPPILESLEVWTRASTTRRVRRLIADLGRDPDRLGREVLDLIAEVVAAVEKEENPF